MMPHILATITPPHTMRYTCGDFNLNGAVHAGASLTWCNDRTRPGKSGIPARLGQAGMPDLLARRLQNALDRRCTRYMPKRGVGEETE